MLRDKVTNILIIGDISICVKVCSEAYTLRNRPKAALCFTVRQAKPHIFRAQSWKRKQRLEGSDKRAARVLDDMLRVMLGQLGQHQKDLSPPAGCSCYLQKVRARPLHCVGSETAASWIARTEVLFWRFEDIKEAYKWMIPIIIFTEIGDLFRNLRAATTCTSHL